jgi:hypothetical protein
LNEKEALLELARLSNKLSKLQDVAQKHMDRYDKTMAKIGKITKQTNELLEKYALYFTYLPRKVIDGGKEN